MAKRSYSPSKRDAQRVEWKYNWTSRATVACRTVALCEGWERSVAYLKVSSRDPSTCARVDEHCSGARLGFASRITTAMKHALHSCAALLFASLTSGRAST